MIFCCLLVWEVWLVEAYISNALRHEFPVPSSIRKTSAKLSLTLSRIGLTTLPVTSGVWVLFSTRLAWSFEKPALSLLFDLSGFHSRRWVHSNIPLMRIRWSCWRAKSWRPGYCANVWQVKQEVDPSRWTCQELEALSCWIKFCADVKDATEVQYTVEGKAKFRHDVESSSLGLSCSFSCCFNGHHFAGSISSSRLFLLSRAPVIDQGNAVQGLDFCWSCGLQQYHTPKESCNAS